MVWANRRSEERVMGDVHVIPVNDLREHVSDGEECWCRPEIEYVLGGSIITHHSMDRREEYETGERKPS